MHVQHYILNTTQFKCCRSLTQTCQSHSVSTLKTTLRYIALQDFCYAGLCVGLSEGPEQLTVCYHVGTLIQHVHDITCLYEFRALE